MTDLSNDAAWQEGYTAIMAGKFPTANPYPWYTENEHCRAWIAGYARGRRDKAHGQTEKAGNASGLLEYWAHGEGAAKIRWGEGGDFDRCVSHLGKYVDDPEGYCAKAHHEALGIWPATHAKQEKLFNPNEPRDAQGRWVSSGDGPHATGHGHGGGTVTLADGEKVKVITEARGNSRAVTRDEFARVASEGKALLAEKRANASPPTGLQENLASIKASTYAEVQKPWGGSTIDAHTGKALASNADKYAVTVKPPGVDSVSIHENPTQAEWNKAVDQAMSRFSGTLSNQDHYLGVFHDDALGRIDLDPTLVVNTKAEAEAIGAYTHNVGGAYNFADGNGYWPPHVSAVARKAMAEEIQTHFEGIGQWYSQSRRLNQQTQTENEED